MKETIKCAAIKRSDGMILAGRNHAFIIKHSPMGTCKKNSTQGFITSNARFVGRTEGGRIAYKAGQIKKPTDLLMSEDITGDNPWAGEIIANLQAENERYKDALQKLNIKERAGEIRAFIQEGSLTYYQQESLSRFSVKLQSAAKVITEALKG